MAAAFVRPDFYGIHPHLLFGFVGGPSLQENPPSRARSRRSTKDGAREAPNASRLCRVRMLLGGRGKQLKSPLAQAERTEEHGPALNGGVAYIAALVANRNQWQQQHCLVLGVRRSCRFFSGGPFSLTFRATEDNSRFFVNLKGGVCYEARSVALRCDNFK